MQNDEGEKVDLYIPRKCTATNRLIAAKDHAAVQINIAHVDENGVAIPGEYTPIALCGAVRSQARSDELINRICVEKGLLGAI